MPSKLGETVYGLMPVGLQCAPLGNLCEKDGVQTGPFGSQLHKKDYVLAGTPIITVEHLSDNRIAHNDLPCVSEFDRKRLAKYSLRAGDIVFSRVGSVDRRALVQPSEDGWLFSGRCLRVRPKAEVLDSAWLSYFFGLPAFKSYIRGIAVGATMPSINTKILSEIPIYYPSIDVQRRGAEVLTALDNRIDLLRQTNATLESIAQALFKSWFIDYDPVRAKAEGREPEGMDTATAALFPAEFEESAQGLIPKGWTVGEVGRAAECVGGGTPSTKEPAYWERAVHHWATPKDLSGLSAPVLLDTERRLSDAGLAKVSSGLLPAGTLLMSSRAPIGYLAIADMPVAINQGFIAMRPGGLLPPIYLYFWCQANMDAIKQKANGSTFMEISKAAFRPIPLVLPREEIVARFVDVVGAIFARIVEAERNSLSLKDLRDSLLPRLVSGRLRMPEIQGAVA
jgi:type I restriction enzyme S subunit